MRPYGSLPTLLTASQPLTLSWCTIIGIILICFKKIVLYYNACGSIFYGYVTSKDYNVLVTHLALCINISVIWAATTFMILTQELIRKRKSQL